MSSFKRLLLTKDFQEVIAYPDVNFPLEIWIGDLNEYLNNELSIHYHDVFEYAYILKGEVIYKINEEKIVLHENEGIFINNDVIHAVKQSGNEAVLYTIGFPSNLLINDSSSFLYRKYFDPIIYGNCKYFVIKDKEILDLMNIIYDDSKKTFNDLHFLSLLIDLWSKTYDNLYQLNLVRSTNEYVNEERMKLILNYIHDNYQEKISVKDLADYLNISKNTCFRLFKKYLGKSPNEYILDYRINKAATFLLHSNKNIISIALECGFENASYFGKIFKKKTKLSPLNYRKEKMLKT